MNKGQGSIGRTNKVEAPAAPPPATVTGADNGLTLLGTIVELGGPLIKNTDVNSGFFLLRLGDILGGANGMRIDIDNTAQVILIGDTAGVNQGTLIDIDDTGGTFTFQTAGRGSLFLNANLYEIGDINGSGNGMMLDISDTGRTASLGDVNTVNNGATVAVNDNLQRLVFDSGVGRYLSLDVPNQLYRIGDISGVDNLTKIDVKDASQAIELDAGTSPSRLTLAGTPGAESLVVNFAGAPYLSLNPVTGAFLLGDAASVGNGIVLSLQDSVEQASISSSSFSMLFLDMQSGIFQLGASAGGTANTSYFQVDDATQTFTTNSGGSVNGLSLDLNNLNFFMGDFFPAGNGNMISISDVAGQFRFSNALNRYLNLDNIGNIYQMGDIDGGFGGTLLTLDDSTGVIAINGATSINLSTPTTFTNGKIGIGVVPINSQLAVSGLQNFANNAAAIVGGLVAGDFYRVSVAGTSAVMVVQ